MLNIADTVFMITAMAVAVTAFRRTTKNRELIRRLGENQELLFSLRKRVEKLESGKDNKVSIFGRLA